MDSDKEPSRLASTSTRTVKIYSASDGLGPGATLSTQSPPRTVPPPFRGRRYGILLAAVALMELARHRVAVSLPAAFEG